MGRTIVTGGGNSAVPMNEAHLEAYRAWYRDAKTMPARVAVFEHFRRASAGTTTSWTDVVKGAR